MSIERIFEDFRNVGREKEVTEGNLKNEKIWLILSRVGGMRRGGARKGGAVSQQNSISFNNATRRPTRSAPHSV